jgi:hypothetical protein
VRSFKSNSFGLIGSGFFFLFPSKFVLSLERPIFVKTDEFVNDKVDVEDAVLLSISCSDSTSTGFNFFVANNENEIPLLKLRPSNSVVECILKQISLIFLFV